jgi:stage V sporulation protein D (sporulation-specific penicillin-binding protein)
VAAPAFKEVMRDSLRYLEVPVRYQQGEEVPDQEMSVVPLVINLPVQEADKVLKNAGLESEHSGSGEIVYGQVPLDGVKVKKGSKVLLNLHKTDGAEDGERVVPDLKGKSMRDAAELLGMMGLVLIPEGEPYPTGIAGEQDPAPGARLPHGGQVKVKFRAPPGIEVMP